MIGIEIGTVIGIGIVYLMIGLRVVSHHLIVTRLEYDPTMEVSCVSSSVNVSLNVYS